jgi:hypothetical protein
VTTPGRSTRNAEEELHDAVAEFYGDPLGYVRFAFPWGQPGTLLQAYTDVQPEQAEVLEYLGEAIRERGFDGVQAVDPIRIAVSSGHGIGKGALTGMLVNFIMSTRRNAKGVITANTSAQLQDKTWAAILYWHKLSITRHWFEANTSILYRRGFREAWKCSPQTCDEENSEAFAGQHNVNSTSFYVNDEDSNVPDKIHEVQEGGLTDGEPMYFLFGNPTRRQGAFFDAVFGVKRHRWKYWVFDSRNSALSNKKLIAEWVEDHGEDSDFVRVRVAGLPPNASDAQYIDSARVRGAQTRRVEVLPDEPLIAGGDLAWGGNDNNVVRFRRGRDARSIPPIRIPGKLTRQPEALVNRFADILTTEYDGRRVDMLFLDSSGIAGPVAAKLRALGHENVREIDFGADSPDPTKTRFYRDYMWRELHDWLPTGAIDKSPQLEQDLQMPGLRPDKHQRIWLESKDDIRERSEGKSPDDGDALALTFAQKVKSKPARVPRSAVPIPAGPDSWMA